MLALITSQVVDRSPLNLGIESKFKKYPQSPHIIVRCLLKLVADNILILLILREIWNDWDGPPHINIHDTNSSSLEQEHM